MARWKKPKVKVRRQPEEPEYMCDLCHGDMADEYENAMFTIMARPCLVPGWKAIVALAGGRAMPVMWGVCLTAMCPRCYAEVDAYRAIIDALVKNDNAEVNDEVWACAPPLTWTEAQNMLAADTAGTPIKVDLNEGEYRKQEETA